MSLTFDIKLCVGGNSNNDSDSNKDIHVRVYRMFDDISYAEHSYNIIAWGTPITNDKYYGTITNNTYYDGAVANDTWEKNKDYRGSFSLSTTTHADEIKNGFRVRLSYNDSDGVRFDSLEIKKLTTVDHKVTYTAAKHESDYSTDEFKSVYFVGLDDSVGYLDGNNTNSVPSIRWFNYVPSGSDWKQVHMTIHLDSGSGADTGGPVWAKLYSQNIPYTNTNQALTLGSDVNIHRESDGDRLYLNNRKDFQDGKTYYDYFYIKDSPESSFNWVQGDPFNVKIYNQSSNAIDIDYIHIEYNSITYKFDNNSDKFITDSNNNRIAIDNTIGWLSPQASDNKPTHRWFKLPGPGWHLFCSSTNTIETWLETKALWNITDRTVQQMYYWNELSLTSSSSLRANHWTAIDFGDTEKVPPNTAYWVQL
jgi:hypothetical protein